MKFLNYDNVLCLSPHPDDAEYGMLGSMLKFKDTQFDIIVFSIGGEFDKSSSLKRHTENINIRKSINNVNGYFLETKYVKNLLEDELIYQIENTYDLSKYDCICVPPLHDAHQDHRKINSIAHSLVRSNSIGIVEYCTPSTIIVEWLSNLFIDISNEYNYKVERLKEFTSQQNKTYFKVDSIRSFHSDYECSKRGINFIERFKLIRGYN